MSPIIPPVINAAMTLLNLSMLLCLAIVIILGRWSVRRQSRDKRPATMLMQDPRQCLAYAQIERLRIKREAALRQQAPDHLPALMKGEHL